jgi:hypothetical protein
MDYAKAQQLPRYCQRGDAPRRLAADFDAGRPVPEWVTAAMSTTTSAEEATR